MADSKLALLIKADDQASKTLRALDKNLKEMKKAAKAVGIGMVAFGAAIVGGAYSSVKAFAEMGDEVQKMALRTGWATETLSELRHVADITGTELSAFNTLTRYFAGAIEDANDGLTTYTRAFDKLGVNYQELKEMKPEDAFWVVSEALSQTENDLERTALAADIFGRSGTQLLPMLAEGADGIRELREEAHELGIVFDQEAANKAAKFKDDVTRLEESIQGLKIEIGETLLPTIDTYTELLTDAIKKTRDWADEHKNIMQPVSEFGVTLGGVSLVMGTLLITMPKLIGLMGTFGMSAKVAGGALTGIAVGVSMIIFGLTELAKNRENEAIAAEHQLAIDEALTEAQKGNTDALYDAINAAKEAGMAMDEQAEAWFKDETALREHGVAWDEWIKKTKEATKAQMEFRKELERNTVLKNMSAYVMLLEQVNRGELSMADLAPSLPGWNIAEAAAGRYGIPGYASGGPINEPTLLYGLSSQRPYAIAHAGENVVPGKGGPVNINLEIGDAVYRYVIENLNNDVRIRTR
jgi:uncharacterized protein with GYD domain